MGRLLRRSSERAAARAFVLEGAVAVTTALAAGAAVEAVYVTVDATGGAVDELRARAAAAGVPVRSLARGVVEKVASTTTPQPVLAVVASVSRPVPDLPATGALLVAVGVADPGNAGTMIRSADATGTAGVVLTGHSVDLTNPKTVRAAAGSLFHVPVAAEADAVAVLGVIGARRLRLGAVASGGVPCDEADLSGAVALVVGNEAHGLPDGLPLDGLISIPMAGRSESLNVAMAATILCYEAARQRARA